MNKMWIMLATAFWFAMPSLLSAQSASPPLPTLETMFELVLERAQREETDQSIFKQCYGYTRTRVTEYRNANGDLKKRKAKTKTNDPTVVPIVYQSPPGVVYKAAPESGRSQPVSNTYTNGRGKAFEKSDFPLNDDLLKRFDFTLAGREVIHGRSALVVDFKPASRKPPERSIKDRFINKAAGRVWVDEGDYALVRANLHLSEKVNVIGGLVGAVTKFILSIERERTSEGLWFIRKQNWHLEGREVFVRRQVDYHEEYKDVQKVHEPDTIRFGFSSVDAEAADD
jgi:hypothetical protein